MKIDYCQPSMKYNKLFECKAKLRILAQESRFFKEIVEHIIASG